jgi:hypothetical protein
MILLVLILSDLCFLPSLPLRAESLPDLMPSSLSLNPTQPKVEDDLTLSFVVRNIGSAASGECYGALFVGDSLETAVTIPRISPGSSGVATVVWVPFIQGLYRITFVVDYWGSISESNLNNNQLVVEITVSQSGSSTLSIITGPSVVEVSQTSAIIYWETSVGSYGWVEYDEVAGLYRYEETDDVFSQTHRIKLADLEPSSTIHFTVFTDDSHGNTIRSIDNVFQTLPLADSVLPHVSLIDPGLCQGISKISAEAFDNVGVERVEFYIDEKLLFTDYSSPFEFSLDTTPYENREHRLSVKAFDFSGKSVSEHYNIEIQNVVDEAKPTIIINSPKQGDTVTGKTKVTTTLSDDAGLTKVYLKVDGVTEAYAGLPDRPKSLTLSFEWDTRYSLNGSHRLAVEAWDIGRNQVIAPCDLVVYNPPHSIPPKLQVTDRMVTRHGNYFEISLTVENVGGSEAREVVITDYLMSFQPISRSDKYADYLVGFSTWTNRGECQIVSKVPIPVEQSVKYSFEAIPVLLPPHPPGIYYTPTIGNSSVAYKGVDGADYSDTFNDPTPYTTGGEFIETAYSNSLKASDYLIITAPARLFQFNNHDNVDKLLSSMAQLARYKSGALGYAVFPYYTNQDIQSLITWGGPWSSSLISGWAQNGYLLIVGEEEIIPAWYRLLGRFYTTSGTINYIANTDYPYASTIGDETVPELSIARIIGDNAAQLKKVIDTSINVYLGTPGYSFDGSNLLLAAGYPSGLSGKDAYMNFPNAVTDASSIFSRKSPNSIQTLLDTSDNTQYFTLPNGTRRINVTKTRDLIENAFFAAAPNQDLIYLAGHGDPHSWDQIADWQILSQPNPFGSSSPVIFVSACNSGAYDVWWAHDKNGNDIFVPEVTGMAEVCLQKGAAVYLGSLNSAGWAPYSNKFFELWGMDVSVSRAVRDLKRSLGDDDRDIMWKGCYQVYGDAKFGAVGYPTTRVSYSSPMVQLNAPSSINVDVPDYVVSRVNGEDYFEIPGGYEFLKVGEPLVPCYKVFYDYPKEFQIQDITLINRSMPVTASGFNIPNANITLPFIGDLAPSEESHSMGWWPVKEYEWSVIENPESITLAITVYPIHYNSQTTEVEFYKSYQFAIDFLASNIEITRVATDQRTYGVGSPVRIDLELSNKDITGKDVIVKTLIMKEGNEEAVSGLPLRILKDLKANSSFFTVWDSTQSEPGYYNLVVELRDTQGALLDKEVEGFTLGESYGELFNFSLNPEGFKLGEKATIKIGFRNTGSIDVSGSVVVRITNSSGSIINEYTPSFTGLQPSETAEFTNAWDTKGLPKDIYKVIGYALYNGESTPPVIKTVGVDTTPPSLTIVSTTYGQVLKNKANLRVKVTDAGGVIQASFSIRQRGPGQGTIIDPEYESIPALYLGDDLWDLTFDTAQISDGEYLLLVNASDSFKNVGSKSVEITIRNQPTLEIVTQKPNASVKIDGDGYQTNSKGYLSVILPSGSHTVEVKAMIETGDGSKSTFTKWGDQSTSNLSTFTVSDDVSLFAEYKSQYYLTITSHSGETVGSGWYDEGAEAHFSVTSPTGFIIQQVFTGWSGSSNATSPTSKITMDGPKTINANWRTDYTQLYILVGILALSATAFMIVVHKKR